MCVVGIYILVDNAFFMDGRGTMNFFIEKLPDFLERSFGEQYLEGMGDVDLIIPHQPSGASSTASLPMHFSLCVYLSISVCTFLSLCVLLSMLNVLLSFSLPLSLCLSLSMYFLSKCASLSVLLSLCFSLCAFLSVWYGFHSSCLASNCCYLILSRIYLCICSLFTFPTINQHSLTYPYDSVCQSRVC